MTSRFGTRCKGCATKRTATDPHEALLVGRKPTGVVEEIVHCTLCDGKDLTWF
jgi:hypothetical protein